MCCSSVLGFRGLPGRRAAGLPAGHKRARAAQGEGAGPGLCVPCGSASISHQDGVRGRGVAARPAGWAAPGRVLGFLGKA